jgi:SAM-dependent methyltransferase
MISLLKKNRLKLNKELNRLGKRKYFSPAIYCIHEETTSAMQKYARGKLIDIGCGDMPYRDLFPQQVTQYDTLDIERRVPDVKFTGNVLDMHMIFDHSYDSALCFDVLEHVPDPLKAMLEVSRILKPGGTLMLSVPHLSRLHEEPNDFFRFTKYGIQYLLTKAGFTKIEIIPQGGLFSFLGHQWSTIFVCSFWHIPLLKNVVFFLNQWFCVRPCVFLDRLLDRKKIFAMAYFVIAKKISTPPQEIAPPFM